MRFSAWNKNTTEAAWENFHSLKAALSVQVSENKLKNDAELHWVKGRGLYVNGERRSNSAREAKKCCGDRTRQQSNECRAAAAEIARSINCTLGFLTYDGKHIGDFIVDQVISERAWEETGKMFAVKGLDATSIDPEQLHHEVEERKKRICLRFADLETLQNRLEAIDRYTGASDECEKVVIAVNVTPIQRLYKEQAVAKSAELLLSSIALDIAAHEYQKDNQGDGNGLDRDISGLAFRRAEEILHRYGLADAQPGGGASHAYANDAPRSTIRLAVQSLQDDGVECKNTLALLKCIAFPYAPKETSDRLLDCAASLEEGAGRFLSDAVRDQLARTDARYAPSELRNALEIAAADIGGVAAQTRGFVNGLDAFAFPAGISDLRNKQTLVHGLSRNVTELNRLLENIYTFSSPALIGCESSPLAAAVTHLFDIAQQLSTETLKLVDSLRPHDAGDPDAPGELRPLDIPLASVLPHVADGDLRFRVCAGLSYEIEPPKTLFQAPENGGAALSWLSAWHNANMKEILLHYPTYLLILKSNLPKEYSAEERDFINRFGVKVLDAVRDNERLTRNMQNQQKMTGETGEPSIAREMQKMKHQRNALLAILYPREVGPVSGAS